MAKEEEMDWPKKWVEKGKNVTLNGYRSWNTMKE